MCNAITGVVQFNIDRRLTVFSAEAEVAMLEEELQEFKDACQNSSVPEQLNALCDLIVLSVGAIHKLGYSPTLALSETVREITSRVGAINEATGKWEKDKDQDPSTLYTPNYNNARY